MLARFTSVALFGLLSSVGACQLNSDFSKLQFTGADEKPGDTGTTDTVVPDASVPDLQVEDNVGPNPDTKPETITPPPTDCLGLLRCVLFDQHCTDFSSTACAKKCAQSDDWDENPRFKEVWSSLHNCSIDIGSEPDKLLACLYQNSPDSVVYCLAEQQKNNTCASTVSCMMGQKPKPCTGTMDAVSYLDCLQSCSKDINPLGVEFLIDVLQDCPEATPAPDGSVGPVETQNEDCVRSLGNCFAESGSISCKTLVNCGVPACFECPPGTPANSVCYNGSCLVGCMNGANTAQDVEMAMASSACATDPNNNVFNCLIAYTKCIEPASGSTSCASVMDSLKPHYEKWKQGNIEGYRSMLNIVSSVSAGSLSGLRSALSCMSDDFSLTPGLSLDWFTCKLKCN